MVHQQLDTLGVGIVVQHLDVKVRIGRHEVEDIALPAVGPVFPANVPSLYKHLLQPVFRCEVNITLHLLVVGGMTAVRLHLRPVYLVKVNGRIIVRIVPRRLADNHLPPYAAVLRGVNPRRVLNLTGFVEVENEVR